MYIYIYIKYIFNTSNIPSALAPGYSRLLPYIKNKTLTNGRTYWECAQRRSGNGCNVKITLDAADRFVAQTHQHTHAADPKGNDLLKTTAERKRSSKDTAEKTQNIITVNIA